MTHKFVTSKAKERDIINQINTTTSDSFKTLPRAT